MLINLHHHSPVCHVCVCTLMQTQQEDNKTASGPSPTSNKDKDSQQPTPSATSSNNNNHPSSPSPSSDKQHHDKPASKTITSSSATHIVGVTTSADGKVHTFTSTSYTPFATTIADDSHDASKDQRNSSAAIAGGVIGGTVLAALLGEC